MNETEPRFLREWASPDGRLFTCGRPGRAALGKHAESVSDLVVQEWAERLLSVARGSSLHLVSLLGHKYDSRSRAGGKSEFSFYSFRSALEPEQKPTLQEWLDARYIRRFVVSEFPTVDGAPGGVPESLESEITAFVAGLLRGQQTVVIVDSGGVQRTGQLCRSMGLSPSVHVL